MRNMRYVPGLVVLTVFASAARLPAQEAKSIAEKHGAAALVDALRDVIDTGADLFNKYGDYPGCYRVYQGGLLSIKGFLHPDLKTKIDQALARAERMPRYSDRAFALRTMLDEIREISKGGPAAVALKKKDDKNVDPKKSIDPTTVASKKKDDKKVELKKPGVSPGAGTEKKDDKAQITQVPGKPAPIPDPSLGQVAGKVVYNGVPAPPGFVTFVGDSQRFSTSITADGTYAFKTAIPPGKYRVAIERVPGAQIPARLDIPERFRAEATSGLTVNIQPGKQALDLNLVK